MRTIIIRITLSILLIIFTLFTTKAQTCAGSLGDPIINVDFGSGTNPGAPLSLGITTMRYVANSCPNDGEYTITNSVNLNSNCHSTWHNILHDHTGNTNGYMMLVNASYNPDVFFVEKATGLCPGTTYEFAAWILNLIKASDQNTIQPDITFSIETIQGAILATYDTKNIPSTNDPTWVQYGTYFRTPNDGSDVIVRMTNNAPGGNGNDLILDDITFRACGPIIQTNFGPGTMQGDQTLCEGGTAVYTLSASQIGYADPQFQWQVNNNGAGWVDINGETNSILTENFNNAIVGTYQYRTSITDGVRTSVNCRVYSQVFTVTVSALPHIVIVAPQLVCEGESMVLLASGGFSYQWSGPNLPSTNENPIIISKTSAANSGKYTVVVTSPQNCVASSSTTINVYPKVVATVNSDVTICQGQSANLSATGGTQYLWSPANGLSDITSPNPIASPTDTLTYTVRVSNDFGCLDTKSVTVNIKKNPVADAGSNKNIFEGQSVKLDGSAMGSIGNVYWTPANYLDNPNSLTPVASPVDDVTYTLHVLSDDNCGSDTASVFVRVFKKIVIPNTFTPNNDGVNDHWDIEALTTYPDCLVTIFNRYGQEIFNSTGYSQPWDGTYNGSPLPVGTYYYVIDLKNNTAKKSGWVFLAR
jgi:gliding motility-associated-like protein